jgi:16S rRNA (cytosine967-C5)-methyltransferase
LDTELTARTVSIDLLITFDEKKNLDYSLANELEPRERAQVREYVQNILRRRSYLDFIIGEFSSIGIDEMKPMLKNILRLGLYEMLFMGGTPDYAAINESVEIAKLRMGSKAGDLVNAILRNIQRDIDKLPKPAFKDRTKLVATTFSHPEWMVARWVKRFGEREAFQLMQANNQRPSYYVRVNNLRTKTENLNCGSKSSTFPLKRANGCPAISRLNRLPRLSPKICLKKASALYRISLQALHQPFWNRYPAKPFMTSALHPAPKAL